MDAGLIGSIGHGLMKGVDSYLMSKNMMEEQALKKMMANSQGLEAKAKIYDLFGVNSFSHGLVKQHGLLPLEEVQQQGQEPEARVPEGSLATPPSSPSQGPSQGTYSRMKGGLIPGLGQVGAYLSESKSKRHLIDEYEKGLIKQAMERETPESQTERAQKEATLRNTGLQQTNTSISEFEKSKSRINSAAETLDEIYNLTDKPTAQKFQSALIQLVKLDTPDQATNVSTIQDIKKNPVLWNKWGDWFSMQFYGQPLDRSVKSLRATANEIYKSKMKQFKYAQEEAKNTAHIRGVKDTSYLTSRLAEEMEKRSNQLEEETSHKSKVSPEDKKQLMDFYRKNPNSKEGQEIKKLLGL